MELWRKNLYAAWIAEMIAITGFSFFMPFIPFYVQELGITDVGKAAQWAGIVRRKIVELNRKLKIFKNF